MARAEFENFSGKTKPCPVIIGCGGIGKKKGKTCKMCAGKGHRIVSVKSK